MWLSLYVIIGGLMFLFSVNYIMIFLFYIELIALGCFFCYMKLFDLLSLNYWSLIYLLVFMVCDAVLGVTLLIILFRWYGHNFMSLFYFSF